MLTQTLMKRVAVVGAAVVILTGLWQAAAGAKGGPAGGGFGGTQCGQSYTPGCTVIAGSPGSSPGEGGSGSGGGTGAGGGPPCTRTGPLTVTCLLVIADPGAAGAGPAPGVLAQEAVRYLRLPDPVIQSSPAPGALQLTGLPTWLWVAPAVWRPQSQTAQVPGEAVTATATPVSASWQMGDGQTVTCHGPGTEYTAADNPASASPTCGYTYPRSSAGQPGGAYQVTVTITWDITWAGTGGAGGVLPPLFTQAAAAMRVAESQAVNTGGGG
jgi:hypothetical protein